MIKRIVGYRGFLCFDILIISWICWIKVTNEIQTSSWICWIKVPNESETALFLFIFFYNCQFLGEFFLAQMDELIGTQ